MFRLVLVAFAAGLALAQQPITFQYFYDDTGQLIKVADSTGIVVEYVYDAVGNMLEIKRSTVAPGGLVIFSFTPQRAGPLTLVTIQGQGFSTTPSGNVVRFGGIAGTVISATPTTLVVEVPAGAATGAITVTVGSNTSTSTAAFTALPVPVVTSLTPRSATQGTSVPSLQVAGVNLTGATFAFVPAAVPPAVSIGTVSIGPGGTSATLSVTVSGNALGDFALVATNSFGSSSGFVTATNSLHVGGPAEYVMPSFTILNTASPAPTQPTTMEKTGLLFSILNSASPASTTPTVREAVGLLFSILNGASPAPTTPTAREAVGLLFSILNGASPAPTQPTLQESDSQLFSILNQAVGAIVSRTGAQAVWDGLSTINPSLDVRSYGPDTDGDGIPNNLERLILTDPNNPDTDGDGFPDGLEVVLSADALDRNITPSLIAPGDVNGVLFSIQNLAQEPGGYTEPNTRRSQ